MDKLFVIPFSTTLISLLILNFLKNPGNLLPPILLISLGMFFITFILKHFTISILFISVAISLITGMRFLKYKSIFIEKKGIDICSEEYVTLRGKLLRFPLIGTEKSIILLGAERIRKGRMEKYISFNIMVTVMGDLRGLYPGDTIIIDTVIRENRSSENFYPGRITNYALVNNFHFFGFSKSALLLRREESGNIFMKITGWIRERVRSKIEEKYLIPDSRKLKKGGQMLEALLLGERGRLSSEVKETLLDTGVFHLFAISGAHIGIIAIFTLFILKKAGSRRRTRYIILISILIFFLVLTGFKISAQRAVLMAVLISISKIFYLDFDMINIISFTGLILLAIDPASFLDPGFILTFAITTGIISGRRLFFQNDQLRASYLKELVLANFNAAVISLPLSLFFFMRYSFSGFFAGLVLLPLTAVIMICSIPIIPLALFPFSAARIPLFFTDPLLKIFFFLADSFSKTLELTIFRASPPFFLLAGFIIFFFLMCYSSNSITLKIIFGFAILGISALLVIKPATYIPEHPEIYFLDVGQGDSQIVVFPGGDSLLIDGGGSYYGDFEVGKNIVLPFILRKGINIKWMAISHFHPDHCRGILEIVNIIEPEEIWISSSPDENPFYRSLLENYSGSSIIKKVKAGFLVERGGLKAELIYPFHITNFFHTKNDHSQVIRVSYLKMKILFTGDIEKYAESEIVKRYGDKLKCDIIKVPHHGSGTSSTPGFLNRTNPDYAVFSLGYKNHFGFPRREVKARYEQLDIYQFYTSERGGIKAILSPGGILFDFSKF